MMFSQLIVLSKLLVYFGFEEILKHYDPDIPSTLVREIARAGTETNAFLKHPLRQEGLFQLPERKHLSVQNNLLLWNLWSLSISIVKLYFCFIMYSSKTPWCG